MAGIELKDAIKNIKSGEWLSLGVITANVLKGTGGKVIFFDKCRIARKQLMEASKTLQNSLTGDKRDPKHNFNFTLNVELPNKLIRTIHPILIFKLNNQDLI